VWGYTKYVTNTKTDEVVYGTMPTDEEYKAQEALAEKRWAHEQATWQQEQDEEYRYWAAEHEAKAQAAIEAEEDRLFYLQDKMLGHM
jgi:hypothetical protein